jgi:hypothetical protein
MLNLKFMSPLYLKIMIGVARYLACPQRVYHAVRSSQNPKVRMLSPFVTPIALLVSLPAFAVMTITVFWEQNGSLRRQASDSSRTSTNVDEDDRS